MKVIRWILIVLVALVALFLVVSLFLPAEYTVTRTTVVNAPVEKVFRVAADFNYRSQWDPWMPQDPEASNDLYVKEGYVGSYWRWEGDAVGKGEMTILSVEENKSITSRLRFIAPQPMVSTVNWHFHPDEQGTWVEWGFSGELGYPVARWFGLAMDSMMGRDFETGLANFKKLVEGLPDDEGMEEE